VIPARRTRRTVGVIGAVDQAVAVIVDAVVADFHITRTLAGPTQADHPVRTTCLPVAVRVLAIDQSIAVVVDVVVADLNVTGGTHARAASADLSIRTARLSVTVRVLTIDQSIAVVVPAVVAQLDIAEWAVAGKVDADPLVRPAGLLVAIRIQAVGEAIFIVVEAVIANLRGRQRTGAVALEELKVVDVDIAVTIEITQRPAVSVNDDSEWRVLAEVERVVHPVTVAVRRCGDAGQSTHGQ
jgi:hypothetical protein